MKSVYVVYLLNFCNLFALSTAFTTLNADFGYPIVWSANCNGCATVERLRATAFGIEIAPDHISLAMKHPNGTTTTMLTTEPGRDFCKLMITWMSEFMETTSLHPNPGLEVLFARKQQTEIFTDSLRHLLFEKEKRYPVTDLEYGGVSIPDFIYRSNFLKNIVEKAVNDTTIRNPKYADLFHIYPTDFVVTAATLQAGKDGRFEIENFDALVITNTTSHLSVSWYLFGFVQHTIGHAIQPWVDYQYFTTAYSRIPSALKYGKTRNPIYFEPESNLMLIDSFVRAGENVYRDLGLIEKWYMSGKSRLILRLHDTTDDGVYAFAKELNYILKGTRFDPASTKTTVHREETADWTTWGPALYVSRDIKSRVDSSTPLGCTIEHQTCTDLRTCVRQEALGDLVLCEDTTPPEPTKFERLEKGVQDGTWRFWRLNFFSWIYVLLDEVEARLWLFYCKNNMPWSSTSSVYRCSNAIVDMGNNKQGVFEEHVGFMNSIVYSIAQYWIGGHTNLAVLPIPIFWIGNENLIKVFIWALRKMLGQDNYEAVVVYFGEIWQEGLLPLWEMIAETRMEEEKGQRGLRGLKGLNT